MYFQRVFAVVLAVSGSAVAQAQVGGLTWVGGNVVAPGVTLAANWSGLGNATLPNDGTADITFAGTLSPLPIIDASFDVRSLTFASDLASFTLANSGAATLTIQSALNQNSGNLQTIAAPIVLGTSGGSTITFTTIGNLNVSGAIGGTGSLTKSGTGTLKLTGNNTYSGGTFVRQGTLQVAAGTMSGAAANLQVGTTAGDAATLAIAGGGTVSSSGAGVGRAGGTGAVTIDGAGTSWTNTGGPLYFGYANSGEPGGTGSLTITNGGSASFSGTPYGGDLFMTAATTLGYGSGSSGTVKVDGTGSALTLTGGAIIGDAGGTGKLIIANGAVVHGANYQFTTASVSLATDAGSMGTISIGGESGAAAAGGGVLDVSSINGGNGNATLVFNTTATTSAPYYFTRGGTATDAAVTITGATKVTNQAGYNLLKGTGNTYSGATTVAGGTLADATAGSLSPNSVISVGGAGTLLVGSNETIHGLTDYSGSGGTVSIPNAGTNLTITGGGSNFSGTIGGAGGVTVSGGALLVLGGTSTYSGGTVINNNNPGGNVTIPQSGLQIGNGGTSGSITGPITNNGFVTFSRSNDVAFSGGISGTGSVNQNGAGTLTLGGANSYSGPTFIGTSTTSGHLADAAAGAFSPNSTITIYGGTLDVGFNETVKGVGDLTINGATSPGAVVLANTATLTLASTGSTFSGVISGPGALVVGSGVFQTLTGANTYTGGTTINNGGVLQVGAGGGTGSIAGNVIDNGTLTFARNNAAAFSGVISGTGSLVQNGTGTLTLTGANTYSGPTTVSAGTVQIGDGGTAGSIAGSVNLNNGALTFNRSDTVTLANVITGHGSLVQAGSGTLILTGANNFSGTTTINAGATLQIGDAGSAGSLFGNLIDNGTLITNRSDTLTLGGAISGSGDLIKRGTGTLSLTNPSSSYTGRTILESGVLAVTQLAGQDASSSLGAPFTTTNATITIGKAGTTNTPVLRYTGSYNTQTDRPIDLVSDADGGARLEVTNSGGVTFSGDITASTAGAKTLTVSNNSTARSAISGAIKDGASGAISLVKSGFGTWEISGANTYTGTTTVAAGTLQLGGTNTIAQSALVRVSASNGSATLALDGTSQQVRALIFGGSSATSFASNLVTLGYGGGLTLLGNVTYDATHGPRGAYITRVDPFSGYDSPYGGSIVLGAGTADVEFNVAHSSANQAADLTVLADISSTSGGGIVKTGAGALLLGGQSTYVGNTTVREGTLLLGSTSFSGSGPTGTGRLILQSGTTLAAAMPEVSWRESLDDVEVRNDVSLANDVTLGSKSLGDISLTFSGNVTLSDASTRLHLGNHEGVLFDGTLGGQGANPATALTFDSVSGSRGLVMLAPTVAPTNLGSITADGTALVFGTPAALTGSFTVGVANNGYLSVGATGSGTAPAMSDLVAHVQNPAAFTGTLGFDTDPEAGFPATFTASDAQPLDFSAFGAGLRLGSLSTAVVAGTIAPPSATNTYQFGNGGGLLFVSSNLGGARSVLIDSLPDVKGNALTVAFSALDFTGTGSSSLANNTYTGNLTVNHSLAVFDAPHALPTGSSIVLGNGGYVGATEQFGGTVQSLAARVSSYQPTSIIGVDSSIGLFASAFAPEFLPFLSRQVNQTIDLSAFGPVYLGTATSATFSGSLIAPGGSAGTLKLVAAKKGYLGVASPLTPSNLSQLVVGIPDVTLGYGGTVALNGANTFTGGTTLLGGTLLLGSGSTKNAGQIAAGPLGKGDLTVAPEALAPALAAGTGNRATVLDNAIRLAGELQLGAVQTFSEPRTEVAATREISGDTGKLVLNGAISDYDGGNRGSLKIVSDTVLNGVNTFTGGVVLASGNLTLGSDGALGSGGTLRLAPTAFNGGDTGAVALFVANGNRTFSNPVSVELFNDQPLFVGGGGSLTFNGAVTLNSSATVWSDAFPVFLNGGISGGGRLTNAGAGALVISGTNTYSGGTSAQDGTLIFGSVGSIPANGPLLESNDRGYIGVAAAAGNLQSDFINKFNRTQTFGTIGFDTSPSASPSTPATVFAGNLDLTGFPDDVRLGSATRAVFSGSITPTNNTYRFGGGGGVLEVNAGGPTLIDGVVGGVTTSRALEVYTPYGAPSLLLRLGGTNALAGGIWVENSGLTFETGALPPAGETGMTIDVFGGYVGTEDPTHAATPATFLDRLSSGMSGIIGFDSFATDGTLRAGVGASVSGAVDLSRFGGAFTTLSTLVSTTSPRVFLGTATRATLSGQLTPDATGTYGFAGYKGGALTVASTLTDGESTRRVQIGDANDIATFGPTNLIGALSSVTLSGDNTYHGGTLLAAGTLWLGSSTSMEGSAIVSGPLGIGPLTVQTSDPDHTHAGLFAAGGSRTLANAIQISSDLDIGGDDALTLSGALSGYGELFKVGSGALTLSGNNLGYGGDIYVGQGSLTFTTANSIGSGMVELGRIGPIAPTVIFGASATVNGIAADDSADSIILGPNVALTVNQSESTDFRGTIGSSGSGASLIYQGPTTSPTELRLSTGNTYTGATTINSGIRVVAATDAAFGVSGNSVQLSGGELRIEPGVRLANGFTFNSGTLSGSGTLASATAFRVGSGAILAPGANTIGTLNFELNAGLLLTLSSGGVYQWQLLDAAAGSAGWDMINVAGNVAIDANNASPFTLQITPVSLDLIGISGIANLDYTQKTSWTVLTATSITGATAGNLAVDFSSVSSFFNGTFTLAPNLANTSLVLTFEPVPEPSTWLLLGLGAAGVLFSLRRRRA